MDHRQERMNNLIIKTFYECLAEEDFSQVTVGKLQRKPQSTDPLFTDIMDKYALRGCCCDAIVQDFAEHMEVDFFI